MANVALFTIVGVLVAAVVIATVIAAHRRPYRERPRPAPDDRSVHYQPGDARPAGPDAESMGPA